MRRMLPYLLVVAAAVAGVAGWRAEQGRRAALERVAQLEAQRTAAGAQIPAAAPADSVPAEPSAASTETKVVRVPTGTDPAPYLRTIDELREQLTAQAKELSTARDEAAKAEARSAASSAEEKKLRAQLDELRDDLQSARRVADAVQAELRVKADRLVKAEASEKLMEERTARAEAAAAKVALSTKEFDDLNRRREAFLTTLLRRFREVNDLYRNFTLNAQTGGGTGAGLQAGDLSRIQSAIQQAEEDLRQLQMLNARMAQIARAK